ncbi:MAG: phosphopantothenoylcysteine decarboxylase / phosphopantothenate---cysteine ligase [Actinomycetota bacterium]|jgi:phosphopantothenoylcysteine decarboxylase/phosphopantothenate--cysteine ligase|nr:phosphopantothenoylcysteine decarboxylase / phosphopantothenate---cysteine ligase [Actinomycetota bacterium]
MSEASPRVILGVCGSIAAYKAVEVCRRLVDARVHVVPVMTADAERFVGAVTLSALASEPVRTSLWTSPADGGEPVPHIALARSADVVLVAPATARFLGAYAAGIADDLLLNVLLATTAPVVVCPAMHTEMWDHPATRSNVAVLRSRGVHVVEPATGRLAGGDEGAGRLPDPDTIVAAVMAILRPPVADLAGRHVVVTAGGTREPIDPVRFLGNRSSGKQGEAVAVEAASRGATVVLVTAAADRPSPPGIEVVRVDTAAEMESEVMARAATADAVVMAAAVADFRPKAAADGKLRKDEGVPDLVLEPTTDILAALGRAKRPGQVLVGFAAETGAADLRSRAAGKLRAKRLDAIVANDVTAPGAGFGHDTNAALILEDDGTEHEVALTSKRALAAAVVDVVARRLAAPSNW